MPVNAPFEYYKAEEKFKKHEKSVGVERDIVTGFQVIFHLCLITFIFMIICNNNVGICVNTGVSCCDINGVFSI